MINLVKTIQDQWALMSPRLRGLLSWAGVFALLVLMKRNALLLPAAWDESWAVLPGGIWLAENNFNIVGLLDQPEWFQYGPATYALAPITWMTGVVAAFTTTSKSFLISLHLSHMAIGAVGLREVYRFARPVWSATASAGLVLVTALVPVMNAQLGFMYLEVPIFTAGMLAVNAGLAGRWGKAAAWGALATSFRGNGVLPIGAVVAAVLLPQRTIAAWRTAALTLVPSLFVGALPILLEQPLATPNRDLGLVFQASVTQLLRMPELVVTLTFAALFIAIPDHRAQTIRNEIHARLQTFAWLILGFIGFYAFTIRFIIPLYVLPRYFIVIVPFVFFAAWEVGRRRFGARIPLLIGVGLVGSMIATSSGALLGTPDQITSVGLESSNQYATRLLLTRDVLRGAISTGEHVYVIPNTWFRSQYPDLGYVDEVPDTVHLVTDLDEDALPDRFIIADTAPNEGSEDVRQRLSQNDKYTSESTEFESADLTARFIKYTRTSD